MNYHKITNNDMLNGEGMRVTLWLSGCSHKCVGCHNPETHDAFSGAKFDSEAQAKVIKLLDQPHISGLTLTGGDPMFVSNRIELLSFIRFVKAYFPDKNIWMYTGHTIEQMGFNTPGTLLDSVLDIIDVLVDGRFVLELKDPSLKWRGSSNQRVIDVKKTISTSNICIYKNS